MSADIRAEADQNKSIKDGTEKKTVRNAKKNHNGKEEIDTSNFTIEERLVAAVWVHERKYCKISMAEIKLQFKMRFDKPPPTKNTLYLWEKKIFETGKVMDAQRSGRPCRRKAHIASVEASLKQAPDLSLRARAERLHLPRTTLKKILEDLNFHSNEIKTQSSISCNICNSTVAKKKIKRKTESVTDNVPCSNIPPTPPTYRNSETIASIPINNFTNYIAYPNSSNHETENNRTVVPSTSHMMTNQQYTLVINPANLNNIQSIQKAELNYPHNHIDSNRNQLPQTFHS